MMEHVSDDTQARVIRAGRRYAKAQAELADARRELVEAMVAEQATGTSNEKIARMTPLSNTQVFRLLAKATAAPSGS